MRVCLRLPSGLRHHNCNTKHPPRYILLLLGQYLTAALLFVHPRSVDVLRQTRIHIFATTLDIPLETHQYGPQTMM
jgi:hypothetical protein